MKTENLAYDTGRFCIIYRRYAKVKQMASVLKGYICHGIGQSIDCVQRKVLFYPRTLSNGIVRQAGSAVSKLFLR